MHRFYIPSHRWNLDALELGPEETHHARQVLRLESSARVTVFNGEGTEATAEIVSVEKDRTVLRRIHHASTPPLPCKICLAQAIPKGKTMDLIIQKATELGVAQIVPLLSDRTVVQLEASDVHKKQERWQQTVIEAAKQCGQNWLPEVKTPVTPRQFFDSRPAFDLLLIGSLQPDAKPFHQVLAEAKQEKPIRSAMVLIGPEGDFTPAESAMAQSYGCRGISLGPIVLRSETAAIYCLSVLGYELFR
jgi:16S rRNA (uracil1498-N3)-methyltransferase